LGHAGGTSFSPVILVANYDSSSLASSRFEKLSMFRPNCGGSVESAPESQVEPTVRPLLQGCSAVHCVALGHYLQQSQRTGTELYKEQRKEEELTQTGSIAAYGHLVSVPFHVNENVLEMPMLADDWYNRCTMVSSCMTWRFLIHCYPL
jgi:hypothetical protein